MCVCVVEQIGFPCLIVKQGMKKNPLMKYSVIVYNNDKVILSISGKKYI